MCLKHIYTGFFIIAISFSVVHNLKVNQRLPRVSKPRPMITEIVRNISRVNNLLENLINNIEQLEQLSEKDDDQSEIDAVSEVKDVFNEYIYKRANVEAQITTISQKNINTTSGHDDLVTVKSLEDKKEINTDDSSHINVVQNLKVNPQVSKPRPVLTEIVKNISRVNHLLENLIKNFEQLEQIGEKDNDQSDNNAVSEVKDVFNEYFNKITNVEEQPTTHSQKNMVTSSAGHDVSVTVKSIEDAMKLNTDDSSDIDEKGNLRANTKFDVKKEDQSIELWKPNNKGTHATNQVTMRATNKKVTKHKPKMSANHVSDSEEDKIIQKEISRAKTLRKAYEDACMKVLQRKCNKALEAVLKDVCSSKSRKCAGDFKKDFKNNGVKGCTQQFDKQSISCRMGHDDSKLGVLRSRLVSSERPKTDDKTKDFNILRTQYEKACTKSNYKKCQAACKYAADKTCKKHECVASKQRAFDKSGEKRCKVSYGAPESDDSEDDDGSDDDDDDDGWD